MIILLKFIFQDEIYKKFLLIFFYSYEQYTNSNFVKNYYNYFQFQFKLIFYFNL
jgi:hypothetical protein